MLHKLFLYLSKPVLEFLDFPSLIYCLAVGFKLAELETAIQFAAATVSFLYIAVRFYLLAVKAHDDFEERRKKRKQ